MKNEKSVGSLHVVVGGAIILHQPALYMSTYRLGHQCDNNQIAWKATCYYIYAIISFNPNRRCYPHRPIPMKMCIILLSKLFVSSAGSDFTLQYGIIVLVDTAL